MRIDNYFRVGMRTFGFDGGDVASADAAWDAARDFARGARVVVWQPPRVRGPWDRAPLVGVSSNGGDAS